MSALRRLESSETTERSAPTVIDRLLYKDHILERTAEVANVAQFVSFDPHLNQRFARIHGHPAGAVFSTIEQVVSALLANAPDGSVNVRSYEPSTPESREFVYGLQNVDDVVNTVRRLAQDGLYTIVNETVDVNDGGVSGVVLGDVIEFAPGDTPRAVEKPGIASLPRKLGVNILSTVYGFVPELDYPSTHRVEFSIHPRRRGVQHGHTIIWQIEEVGEHTLRTSLSWPNRFSRFVGDKVFGLLVADALGAPVPYTLAISRWLPPYQFGRPTGTQETWIRTCPTEQQPGHFTTSPNWTDPFALLQHEDPEGTVIASVLAQEGVDAQYSGALVVGEDGTPIVEGVSGQGDKFMLGTEGPVPLPPHVTRRVLDFYQELSERTGPIRMEWVFDGLNVWVLQMHVGATRVTGDVIVPGDASSFRRFDVDDGLEALRIAVEDARNCGDGIILVGNVGITSHFGDVLRRSGIPSRIERVKD